MSKKGYYLIWLAALFAATVWILRKEKTYRQHSGMAFGTLYHITYLADKDLCEEINAVLALVDTSLSMFNQNSSISLINRNEDMEPDSLLKVCLIRALEISEETNGAFDITIAPLVNAWGFGFRTESFPDSARIDSLLLITGYGKIRISQNRIVKDDPAIMLDCSAIAKGFAVDLVAEALENKGVKNYMVEIGGEIRLSGRNPKGKLWQIGINKPLDDTLAINDELHTVLAITNKALATSGNYRNYYYKGGKKYAHTIDPHTGYPAQSNLLSATVVADDCLTADALATAFMVMGKEEATVFCQTHPRIEAYLIYATDNDTTMTYYTKGMENWLTPLGH